MGNDCNHFKGRNNNEGERGRKSKEEGEGRGEEEGEGRGVEEGGQKGETYYSKMELFSIIKLIMTS